VRRYILFLLLYAFTTDVSLADYGVRILKSDPPTIEALYKDPSGKTISDVFGQIEEIRIEIIGNRIQFDEDSEKLKIRIRHRVDRSKCLGRFSEIKGWSMAPWAEGYLLLESGRIVPIRIMLSGILIDDLLFGE
jgi:hypothetical protein